MEFKYLSKSLKFIDLFAGLGGFHLALTELGHRCVFASELDGDLAKIYRNNFGLEPKGDIRECWAQVPDHDILCAGFPCQPFSKAGQQKGVNCPESGDLFEYVVKVIDARNPTFLILENVPNLVRHGGGSTWKEMRSTLERRGYEIDCHILSPAMFGVPQQRDRAIIVGSKISTGGLASFDWPVATHSSHELSILSVLDVNPNDATSLPSTFQKYLEVWQEFLDRIPAESPLPSFPIWSMEFGSTYPYEDAAPAKMSSRMLARYKGQFGETLSGKNREEKLAAIPPYARGDVDSFPDWKVKFIRDNRNFFLQHQDRLKSWLPKVREFAPSFQKFEWNWKDGNRSVWDKIIQFRASGIRVKRPTVAPSLVALTTSQVPVIPWERRYMTMKECARLQSMDALLHLPESNTKAHQALGNAVNVQVVKKVAQNLLGEAAGGNIKVEAFVDSRGHVPAPQEQVERTVAV